MRNGFPMERLAIDIVVELPLKHNGNKYILVISDYFTKWTEALDMPNMEACTVAKLIVENVLCRFLKVLNIDFPLILISLNVVERSLLL